jgi:hypothetical protein
MGRQLTCINCLYSPPAKSLWSQAKLDLSTPKVIAKSSDQLSLMGERVNPVIETATIVVQ